MLEPFAPGAWVLPSISADVPLTMTRGASATDVNGASLALDAHALGVRIPDGEFTTVKDTLTKQLAAFVSKQIDPAEPVDLDFHLSIAEEEINLVLAAQSSLDVLILGPLIERLNEHVQGLGWFVYEIISRAGLKYPVYNDAMLLQLCEMLWFDPDQTDADFAEYLLEENGEERDGRSDDEIIESLTAGYRPSDALDMIGGHAWMMGTHCFRNGVSVEVRKRPRSLPLREVNRLLQSDMPQDLRDVVIDTLKLRKQVVRKNQKVHTAYPFPQEEDGWHGQPYGASCIAVWQWTDFAQEVVNHFEECEMNAGESNEIHMHFRAYPDDEESIEELIRSFKDVVAWHSAIGRVLKHFPKG